MPHAPQATQNVRQCRRRNADLACNNMGQHFFLSLYFYGSPKFVGQNYRKLSSEVRSILVKERETRHSEYDRSFDHSIYSFLEVARECKCINLLTDRSIHWSTIICPNWSTGSVHYADTDRSWVINSHSLEAFKKKKLKLRTTISENWKNSIDRCTGDRMILNVREAIDACIWRSFGVHETIKKIAEDRPRN